MAIHVFYANRHYASYVRSQDFRKEINTDNSELYNGAFIFWQPDETRNGCWIRADLAPAYLPDITEEMKAYLLLLGAF